MDEFRSAPGATPGLRRSYSKPYSRARARGDTMKQTIIEPEIIPEIIHPNGWQAPRPPAGGPFSRLMRGLVGAVALVGAIVATFFFGAVLLIVFGVLFVLGSIFMAIMSFKYRAMSDSAGERPAPAVVIERFEMWSGPPGDENARETIETIEHDDER